MAEKKEDTYKKTSIRVDSKEYEEFKIFCKNNDSDVSKEFNKFIKKCNREFRKIFGKDYAKEK